MPRPDRSTWMFGAAARCSTASPLSSPSPAATGLPRWEITKRDPWLGAGELEQVSNERGHALRGIDDGDETERGSGLRDAPVLEQRGARDPQAAKSEGDDARELLSPGRRAVIDERDACEPFGADLDQPRDVAVVELTEMLAENGARDAGGAHDAVESLDGQILLLSAVRVGVDGHGRIRAGDRGSGGRARRETGSRRGRRCDRSCTTRGYPIGPRSAPRPGGPGVGAASAQPEVSPPIGSRNCQRL